MDIKELIEDWIVYLKSKGIANKQSNPDGTLNYTRGPASSDVSAFLQSKGFSREDIRVAMSSVGQPARPATDKQQDITTELTASDTIAEPAVANKPTIEPGRVIEFPGVKDVKFQWGGQQWRLINKTSGKASKIANREVANVLTKFANNADVSPSELMAARRKLNLFASKEYTGNALVEAFTDATYSESQISKIFNALLTSAPEEAPTSTDTPEKTEEQEIAEINAIKQSIRDNFSDKQRRALLRILSNA